MGEGRGGGGVADLGKISSYRRTIMVKVVDYKVAATTPVRSPYM